MIKNLIKNLRLNASMTVENSVIIPIFTIIIVADLWLSLTVHDEVIEKNICRQAVIKLWQEGAEDGNSEKITGAVTENLNVKSMVNEYSTSYVKKALKDTAGRKSDQENFIWQINAGLKLKGK